MGGIGKLITCDLVCSGVASPMAWLRYLASLEKRYGAVADYEQRPKTFGERRGSNLPERAVMASGQSVQGERLTRSWTKAYVGRWNLRPVCHDCPFHSMERPGAITIGDFWGLREQGGAEDDGGISLVLVNNESSEAGDLVRGLLEHSTWEVYGSSLASNPRQPRLSSSPEPNAVRSVYLQIVARFGHVPAFYGALALAGLRRVAKRQHVSGATERLIGEPAIDASGNRVNNRLIRHKGDCYGCGACASICPNRAISMLADVEGFSYPYIDEDACVGCGLCERVCPRKTGDEVAVSKASNAYAVRFKDDGVFLRSSSGGAFWGLAEEMLNRGGVVYGVAYNDALMPHHIRCADAADCKKCMGSKYVQSNMGTCCQSVRSDLLEGKDVLFTGTPCQIAGLKQYLNCIGVER